MLKTKRQCVSQSHDFVEGTFVHEAGHLLEDKVFSKIYTQYGIGKEGVYGSVRDDLVESRTKHGGNISAYAVSDTREYIAESFTAWWFGETDNLDKRLVSMFEGAIKR